MPKMLVTEQNSGATLDFSPGVTLLSVGHARSCCVIYILETSSQHAKKPFLSRQCAAVAKTYRPGVGHVNESHA
jgi:hypothetical protein